MDNVSVRAESAPCKPFSQTTWSQVPHQALDAVASRHLIPTDLVILGVLLRYARATATCWPSVPTIARGIGRQRRAVQLRLRVLEAQGWIATRPADNPTGREFVLVWREREQEERAQSEKRPPRKPHNPPPLSSVAPEWNKNPEKKKPASPSCPLMTGTTTPEDGKEPLPSPAEVKLFFATLRQRPHVRPVGRFHREIKPTGGLMTAPTTFGETLGAMYRSPQM